MTRRNEKLQRARLERHWSLASASRRVGVSANTFNRWERGLQVPQLATLDQLCVAFGSSAEELGFGFVVSPQKRVEAEDDTLASEQATHKGEYLMGGNEYPGQYKSWQLAQEEKFLRRQALASLISMPAAVFQARSGNELAWLHVEEILTVCASSIPLCWQLYFDGGLFEVEAVLPEYISELSTLARAPSAYQKKAASLLSQAYQLASLLATQHQNYGQASLSAQQALFYGRLAEDPNLQLTSFIRQALVFFYLKRPRLRQQEYQKALHLISTASPLLQGRVFIGLVEVCSNLGQETEARHFLELAQRTFPSNAEEDAHYAYTHFSFSTVSTLEGIMYLNLNQPDLAWQALERSSSQISGAPVPDRLELIVLQAAVALALGELEQTCQCIRAAVPMARDLGSQLRVDESYEVYEQMLTQWGDERAVKELEKLFRLRNERDWQNKVTPPEQE